MLVRMQYITLIKTSKGTQEKLNEYQYPIFEIVRATGRPVAQFDHSDKYKFSDCKALSAASSGVMAPVQQSYRGSMTM